MKKIYLLLSIVILISCEKEEILTASNDEINYSVEEIDYKELPSYVHKSFLNIKGKTATKKSDSHTGFGSAKTNVPSKKIKNNYGFFSYTVPLSKVSTEIINETYFDNLVINELNSKEFTMRILRYKPDPKWLLSKDKLLPYSGLIEFYTIEGEKIGEMELENGKQIHTKSIQKGFSTTCTYTFGNEICSGSGSTERCLITYSESCTTTYTPEERTNESIDDGSEGSYSGGGGGTSSGGTTTSPILEEKEEDPTNTECIMDSNGNCFGEIEKPTEEEDKINTDNLNNDCVEGIIEKLQVKDSQLSVIPDLGTEVSHLSQIILDLFKTSNEYHLNFKIGDATNANGHARNAYTSPSSNRLGEFTFTITLDQGYIENASQLAIARTIIHESLHAYLGYLYQDDPTTTFMQKLNRYRTEKSKLGEHEFMTQFTEAIGASLASWDNHSLDHILNYYEALGWSGDMLKTTAFDKLDEDFQELIKEANKAEGDAINKATTNAKGEKCP
ncbi:hypothetical protein [Salinimicrobium sp. WS361]|uniref:hypothetical protein n=1 Tax=Salinimicrobium sp. WS361 TaxID=3425123 RepID=UPI003D6FA169